MSALYTYSDPKLHDKEVQTLQNAIAALSWVQDAYPLVRKGQDDKGNTFPQVYKNDGTDVSVKVTPDSDVNCLCFFELDGNVERFPEGVGKYTYPLSVTFWLQLDKVYPAKNYDYTSELIVEIVNLLITYGCENISYTTEDIFDGFSELEDINTKFMRTYSAFKIFFSKEGTQCN